MIDSGERTVQMGGRMNITATRVHLCRLERARPIRNGRYTYATLATVVVRLRTRDGVEGIGFTTAQPGPDLAVYEAACALAGCARGLAACDVERLWDRMFQPKIWGRRGLATRAMSAVDIAMWDAFGRSVGMPVHRLLGGFADRVPVYLAGGYYAEGKGLDDLACELREKAAAGAQYVKIKVGGAPMHKDVERVRVAREAVGDRVGLMLDANNAYATADAIAFARRVERYDPFWFEEPVHAEDYEGLARVKRGTAVPVAAGENEYTRYGFRDLIASGGVDYLQPDATVLGGVTEWRHVASLASAHGLPVAPHGSSALHVHLVAAVSNGRILEHVMSEGETVPLFTNRLALDADGTAAPPGDPGFGFHLDEDVLAHTEVRR
jgi:D-arabinonate dehydratase